MPFSTFIGRYPGYKRANVDNSGPIPFDFSHSNNFLVNFLEIPSNFNSPSAVRTTTSFDGGSATTAFFSFNSLKIKN